MPIQIEHVHYSFSYQQATHTKYDWHGHESSSGYGLKEYLVVLETTLSSICS